MASHGEKILVLELVASQVLVTAKELSAGNVPRPSQYISSLMLFAVLGGMAAIGPGPASVASALGAVILITLVVNEKGVSVLGIFKVGTGSKGAKVLPFPKQGGLPPGGSIGANAGPGLASPNGGLTTPPAPPVNNLRPGAPAPISS